MKSYLYRCERCGGEFYAPPDKHRNPMELPCYHLRHACPEPARWHGVHSGQFGIARLVEPLRTTLKAAK
jgi:DNA-directed RNA polymerase subunit RPC12/RpoP